MQVFRIAKQNRIEDLTGKGAEMTGGRWNEKGIPALYASTSLPLCICEILVHADRDIPPSDMYFAELFIPDDLVSDRFAAFDFTFDTVTTGSAWLKDRAQLAIRVPSILLPRTYAHDCNVLINPRHPDFGKVKITSVYPCPFDGRFFVG